MTVAIGATRKALCPVDGLLLLNKPAGITSNRALQKVKRLLQAKKGGHTGSLDPAATGMLPLCFGEATKVCAYLLEADKFYHNPVILSRLFHFPQTSTTSSLPKRVCGIVQKACPRGGGESDQQGREWLASSRRASRLSSSRRVTHWWLTHGAYTGQCVGTTKCPPACA